ncbi:MAG: methyl-accepting chemotaxis protein [Planctomycetota bacterium]|nr:MAG: methyl-accepting chemotaxis protein [Planctomycetota bacterium]
MQIGLNQRLSLGMGGLLALVAFACVVGLAVMSRTGRIVDGLLDQTFAEAGYAASAESSLLRARRAERDFLLSRDLADVESIHNALGDLDENLGHIRDLGRADLAEKALAASERYASSIDALAAAYEERGLTHQQGREGELRAAVHALETDLKSVERPDLQVLMLMARRHEKDYLLRGDAKYLKQVEQRLAEFRTAASDLDEDTRARWDGLWVTYAAALRALVQAEEEIAERTESARAAAAEIDLLVSEIHRLAMEGVAPARASLVASQSRARVLLIGVLIVGVPFAGLIAWCTIRSVIRSIRPVVARASAIADGDLTGRPLQVRTNDDLGRLAGAMNKMSDALRGLIREVNDATGEVMDMAKRVAAGSAESADDAQRMARELADLSTNAAAAVTEMSASIEEVAGQSVAVAESASDAGRNAAEGERVVGETAMLIRGLAERIETLGGVMNRLGDRSEQIGSIIGVINDIADQTNLLALNAAIEAARAGEHGRGFAVVADEVRKLADRTTEATAQVTQSIREIQEDTRSAVGEM